jgi:hypothetical protein
MARYEIFANIYSRRSAGEKRYCRRDGAEMLKVANVIRERSGAMFKPLISRTTLAALFDVLKGSDTPESPAFL